MNTFTRRQILGVAAAGGAAAGLNTAMPGALARAAQQIAAKPEGEPIVIGHQCELTGWDASTGYWRNQTATALVGWLNDNGGIAGRPVKLITVDTKSDVDAGVTQLRKLMLEDKVDLIIGAELTSIAQACGKLAQENKTVYLTMSTSAETTGKGFAQPYQFRMTSNSAAEAAGATKQMVQQVGKRWTVLYADYAWGQSERDGWAKGVAAVGGEVVSPVGVPLDAQDLFPYVGRIDRSVNGIYIPVLNALQTIQTIREAGLKQDIVLAGLSFSLFDYRDLKNYGEGVWGIELAPVELDDLKSANMAKVYELMGVGSDGVEKASGKVVGASMVVGIAQSLGFLKAAVEGASWKGKEDGKQLIKWAETHSTFEPSLFFPVAAVDLRPQDHTAFMDLFIVRIENGRLRSKARIAKENTVYPADVDLTKA